MADIENIVRTAEEEIEVIDLEIARIDEILAGQVEPELTLPETAEHDSVEGGELSNLATASHAQSHQTWTEQVAHWNTKKEQLLQRKTELAAE